MPLLSVGRVARPHGLSGDVVVELWTDRTERLDAGTVLSSDLGELRVTSSRPHGVRHLVRFEGVHDREGAEALRGVELRAAPLHVEGVLWVHELVGATVVTVADRRIGTVVALEDNPASDLLVLDNGVLVPLRFVVTAVPGAKVIVDIPEGLADIPEGLAE